MVHSLLYLTMTSCRKVKQKVVVIIVEVLVVVPW